MRISTVQQPNRIQRIKMVPEIGLIIRIIILIRHAGLLTTLNSTNLEFITEPEAVVLRCLNVVNLRSGESCFSICSLTLDIYDNIWTNIIPVLAKYSNTLTKLYFCNVSDEDNDIPLSFIGSFKILQEIIFSFSPDDDLESLERCSAIFLVGEFSYLSSRVREVFIDQVSIIAVPALSTALAARGAITYGLNVERTFLNGLKGKFVKVWLRV
ncbi:unnamed protein product [Rhizophagus irregularis]|nr:unnamed protein product [Rhizophagus irregularis]